MRLPAIIAAGVLLCGSAALADADRSQARYCLAANATLLDYWRAHPNGEVTTRVQAQLLVAEQRLAAFLGGYNPKTVAGVLAEIRGGADAETMLRGTGQEAAGAYGRIGRCADLLWEIP